MERVLLVTNIFPPQIGGPATFIERTATRLAEQHGIRVTVICSSERAQDPADRQRPYRVRRIDSRNIIRYNLRLRRVLFQEMLRHRRILVNGLEAQSYQIARLLRRSFVLKVVGDDIWQSARNNGLTCLDADAFLDSPEEQQRFRDRIARRGDYLRYASRVVTPSQYLRNIVIRWGVPSEKVITILNGVETERAATAPAPRRHGDPLRVVYIGRLTNFKGADTLILASLGLENTRVSIVGDGPCFPVFHDLATQIGILGTVQFLGRRSAAEVQDQLRAAHVLVLPSLVEGLSHTMLEGMINGVACVASDRGGNPEVITSGVDGLLVPAHDVGALHGALRRLEADDALRIRLAVAGQRSAQAFSMERTVQAFTRLLMGGEA